MYSPMPFIEYFVLSLPVPLILSGKVICIGMAAYDWYDENKSDHQYRGNIEKLTSNALDYLSK